MFRRFGLLASLALTAAVLGPAATAQAQTIACTFTGLSGQLTNPLPGALEPGAVTLPPGTRTGGYGFSGRGNCAGRDPVSGAVLVPTASVNGNTDITSNGQYDNIVCGTGWAWDKHGFNTVVDPDPPFPTMDNVAYEIFFTAGNGDLRIGSGPATAPHAGGGSLGGEWSGSGEVHLQPVDGNCMTDDVAEFSVAGSFEMTRKIVAP